MAVSLSSLQAALRKGPPAKVGAGPAASPKGGSIVAGQPQGVKRPPPTNGPKQPPHKVFVSSPEALKAGTVKAAMQKGPPASPPTGSPTSSPGGVAKAAVPKPRIVVRASDGGVAPSTVRDLMLTLEQAPAPAKVRSALQLADALGSALSIEHLNHFLRRLRDIIVKRAAEDQAAAPPAAPPAAVPPPQSLPAAVSPAQQASSNGVAPGTTAAPPVASAAQAAAQPRPQQPAPTPAPVATPREDRADQTTSVSNQDFADYVNELRDQGGTKDEEGNFDETKFEEVIKKLWGGVAKKPRDWATIWGVINLPVDKQVWALKTFVNLTFVQPGADIDKAASAMAELAKTHKVKLRTVEVVLEAFGGNLDGMAALNPDIWQMYAHFLVHIFPKPLASGWGWSRVGWSWQVWWRFSEQCLSSLSGSFSSDVICLLLKLLQDREGAPLADCRVWDQVKFTTVLGKVSSLAECTQADVRGKLAAQGVSIPM